MKFLMRISREAGKPLFIGEVGQTPKARLADQFRQVETLLRLIQENGVQLSALWNYDFEHEDQAWCNITPTNARSGMLELLKQQNTTGK